MGESMRYISLVFTLSKINITIAVSFTTFTGYVLGNGHFDLGFVPVSLGIFLLACSSSVINHLQEIRTDSLMERTFNRPLPRAEISKKQALWIASIEFISGSFILMTYTNLFVLLLGLFAMFWYNGVYTNLKRYTAHAVVPGSLIGAIPPVAGWMASGASFTDFRVWTLALFFFSWQVPHFYLLALKFGREYKKAGFPSLRDGLNTRTMQWLIFLWLLAASCTGLFMYYFKLIESLLGMIVLSGASLWILISFSVPMFKGVEAYNPFLYFKRINYYVLIIILVLNFDHLFQKIALT